MAKTKQKTVLVLRTCDENMQGHGGFQWPRKGKVSAPDWSPEKKCGGGLHGLLWGEGDAGLLSPDSPNWLVVKVVEGDVVDLGGKVKFPSGTVVFSGDKLGATAFMANNSPSGHACAFGTSTSGDYGTSTSGYRGTSTSGDYGTSTSGDYGTSTSGYGGTSTSGYRGTSTSGDYGTSTSGYRGTSTSGDCGTSTSGDYGTSTSGYGGTSTSGVRGTSTSGDYGTSTSGDRGTSTSGDGGTSTSGDDGTATSGNGGTVVIKYYHSGRKRLAVGYVGEDGIEPNVPYVVVDGKLVRK